MENPDNTQMEAALERLLKRATAPEVPEGAEARVMAAIRAATPQPNVVPFPQRSKFQGWVVGVPLAASLVLGMYFGAQGTLDNYLPEGIVADSLADASEPTPSTGLDDAESYVEGDLT